MGKPIAAEEVSRQAVAARKVELPEALVNAVKGQRAILFLGAGASMDARDDQGHTTLSANELKKGLCNKFLGRDLDGYSLMAAAEIVFSQEGKPRVLDWVGNVLRQFHPQEAHNLIPSFHWKMLATTNYDIVVERAYRNSKNPVQTLLPFVKDIEPIEDRTQQVENGLQYLKLHGCIDHIQDSDVPLILSPEDYEHYLENRERLFNRLRDNAVEFPLIFIGYSLSDPHIRSLIYRLNSKNRSQFYLVTPNATEVEVNFWAQKKVTVVKATMDLFMKALDESIPEQARKIKVSEKVVDQPIRAFYKTNDAETTPLKGFLDKDVTFVHDGMDYIPQDPKEFYRGIDTGWGFAFNDLDVRRTITEECLLSLFDFIEAPKLKPQFYIFKGPAGNGKTVALKRTALELAKLDQLVLWVEESAALNPEAISDLYDFTGKAIFLCIDRLALHSTKVKRIWDVATKKCIPLIIIGAERDSEWFGYCGALESLKRVELRVRYLSGKEINGLIDRLSEHHSLGLLTDKPRDIQFAAFHDSAERQLLVALHEATQGKRFEDIIFEEYNDIATQDLQQLYLDVCTMHQFGVPVRAGTINRITGISFTDYNERIFRPLENIIFDIRDSYTGDIQYKARHARVANMVFRLACPTNEERADQLIRLLNEIDIGFSVDKQALERLVKAHQLSKVLDIPAGRRIFEVLTSKLPTYGYIYQQWAIFESLDHKGDLAAAQRYAEKAKELDEFSKPILHTLAEIARKRANSESSPIAKEGFRRQSRARLCEIKNPNDRYVLATQIKLLIDELEEMVLTKDTAPEEILKKTQDIEDFFSKVRSVSSDPEFNEIEARFRKILSQDEKVISALERAFDGGSQKDGLTVNLAKAYCGKGNLDMAYQTLGKGLERSPDSKVLHLAYAKILLDDENPNKQRIHDHLIRSFDNADSNYEARYIYAQLLFSLGQYPEAAKVFVEIDSKAPDHFYVYADREKIFTQSLLQRQNGTIAFKSESVAFVTMPGYPNRILAPEDATDFASWDHLKQGSDITFMPIFNRKGPVASDMKIRT